MKKSVFLLVSMLVFAVGCKKSVPDTVIPPKKMVEILQDIHLVDALVAHQELRYSLTQDSIQAYYNNVYKKHNFTREEFEKTLKFYAHNPDMLKDLYAGVLQGLERRDSIVKANKKIEVDTIQLWRGQSHYTVEEYTNKTLAFKIPASYPNTYYISAEIKMYDDSQLRNFSPIFGFIAKDTIYNFRTEPLRGDTIFQPIVWQQMASDTTTTFLVGDFAPQGDSTEIFKHYEIKNIKIYTTQIDNFDALDDFKLE